MRELLPGEATDVDTLSAAFPIVLLPVRLETRFGQDDSGGEVLRVRVYPDELMADTHEPPLTEQERDAGIAFWRDGWVVENERHAWRALVSLLPAPRAAWVARVLTPVNIADRPTSAPVFPDVELRSNSWTRAAEARVLPDRWLVIAYRGRTAVRRAIGLPIQEPLALSLSPIPDDEVEDHTVEITSDGLRLDTNVAWTVDFARALDVGMAVTLPLDADLATGIDRLIVVGVKSSLAPEECADRLARLLDAHHYTRGLAFIRQGTPTNNTPEAPSGVPLVDRDGASSFAVERTAASGAAESNGPVFTRALGLPDAIVSHVEYQHSAPNSRTRAR